jgi:hypothetical protein
VKSAYVNLNLYTGIAMLIVGALFVAWALLRPLSAEVEQAEAEQAGSWKARAEPGRTSSAAAGATAPGGNRASTCRRIHRRPCERRGGAPS